MDYQDILLMCELHGMKVHRFTGSNGRYGFVTTASTPLAKGRSYPVDFKWPEEQWLRLFAEIQAGVRLHVW